MVTSPLIALKKGKDLCFIKVLTRLILDEVFLIAMLNVSWSSFGVCPGLQVELPLVTTAIFFGKYFKLTSPLVA